MRRILIFCVIFMLFPTIALCSMTKVLDRDTELHPQGWISGSLKFKQGTAVELNERGEVISGVLRSYENLRPAGRGTIGFGSWGTPSHGGFISFKGDNSITIFDEHGYVTSGTIGEDSDIYLCPNNEPMVNFKFGTAISFDKEGNLINGTLKENTYLRPVGWNKLSATNSDGGFLKFQAGTEIILGSNAQIIKGTIADDLTVNGRVYPAGTKLQFSESDNPQRI